MENSPPPPLSLPLPSPPPLSLPLPSPPPLCLPLPSDPPPLPPAATPTSLRWQLPPRAPAPTGGVSLPMLFRALASSSVGVAARNLSARLLKELWSDPRRAKDWFKAVLHNCRPPPPHRPHHPTPISAFRMREELDFDGCWRGGVICVIIGLVFVLLMRKFEDDEAALRRQHLPGFVRLGLGQIVGFRPLPPRPLRAPTSLLRAAAAARDAEANKDGLKKTEQPISSDPRDAEAHKDGGMKTEQAISRADKEMLPKDKTHKDVVNETQQAISSDSTKSVNKTETTSNKFCKDKSARQQILTGKFVDQISVKRMNQLQRCLAALDTPERRD